VVIIQFKHDQSKTSVRALIMRLHIESEINRTSATGGRIDKASRDRMTSVYNSSVELDTADVASS